MAESEEGSDDGEEEPIKSVIGTNALREFVMLPKWTVNDFTSTIKEKHFSTLKSKKCYYKWGRRRRGVRTDAEGKT